MFSGAKNTLVTGGTFTIHAPVTSIRVDDEKGIKLLRDNVASGAFHNSAERYDPPKCHPGTRKVIIKEIMDWIETIDKEEFFLWLYGPAGAGKSAIAQSIAELCHKAGLLAASFFFSRTAAGRNDATLLIPTLAYQLTVSIPEIIKHISMAVEKDSLIFTRSLEAQLKALIIEPLSKLTLNRYLEGSGESISGPMFIIIDGLDECGQPKTQRYILTTLSSAVRRYHIPLFFLIASRPEQEIRDVFNEDTMALLTRRLVLDATYKPDADIKIFLASKFAKIKQGHPLASNIPSSWPSDFDLKQLIRKASGQFIYASTVIKFIESPRHRPTDRLDIVFGLKTPGRQTPFATLDILYTFIFASVEDIEAVLDFFMFFLLFSGSPYDKEDPRFVEAFLGYEPGDLQIILADLHSVILVPPSPSKGQKLRLFHASLGDFLMDKSRSGEFFIDAPKAHARIAECCIKHASTFMLFGGGRVEKISCGMLINECSYAYPTKELLRALGSFRFDTFLALRSVSNEHIVWPHTLLDLSKFFDWIQQQSSQTHTQGCLYRRYTTHIDYHLQRRVSDYPPSDSRCQYLFTALTLVSSSFAFRVSDFLSIINRYDVTPSLRDLDSSRLYLIDLMDPLHGCPHSRSMLIAFFTDRVRSGSCYRTQSRYIGLATKCLDHLCANRNRSADKCASMIVLDILSRFPGDHRLVQFLRVSTIRKDVDRREEIVKAIKAYIKDYDLSTVNVPSSGPGTHNTSLVSTPRSAVKRKHSQRPSNPFERSAHTSLLRVRSPAPQRSTLKKSERLVTVSDIKLWMRRVFRTKSEKKRHRNTSPLGKGTPCADEQAVIDFQGYLSAQTLAA